MSAVDAQFGDEDAQERLGLLGLAVCDDAFELACGGGEVGWRGRVCGLIGVVVGEIGLLGAEVIEAGVFSDMQQRSQEARDEDELLRRLRLT